MTAPDENDTSSTGTNDDLHGAAEEVEEGMQGGSGDDDAAPTPGGG